MPSTFASDVNRVCARVLHSSSTHHCGWMPLSSTQKAGFESLSARIFHGGNCQETGGPGKDQGAQPLADAVPMSEALLKPPHTPPRPRRAHRRQPTLRHTLHQTPNHPQHQRRIPVAHPTAILVQRHVQWMMQRTLDHPVPAFESQPAGPVNGSKARLLIKYTVSVVFLPCPLSSLGRFVIIAIFGCMMDTGDSAHPPGFVTGQMLKKVRWSFSWLAPCTDHSETQIMR